MTTGQVIAVLTCAAIAIGIPCWWLYRGQIRAALHPAHCRWDTWWHAGQTHMVPEDRTDHTISDDGDCYCNPTQVIEGKAITWWHVDQRQRASR